MQTVTAATHGPYSRRRKRLLGVLFVAGNIISASTAYGNSSPETGNTCFFTIQLQSSPFREQYMTRVALETGTVPASGPVDDSAAEPAIPYAFRSFYDKPASPNAPGDPLIDPLIDPLSRDCLACHSYSAAGNVEFNYRNAPSKATQQKYAGGGKDHPNGMAYNSYVALGKGKFKPVSLFDSKMIFVNGRVGCLTCHNPLNPEQGHLVKSDFGSALCETCHNLTL